MLHPAATPPLSAFPPRENRAAKIAQCRQEPAARTKPTIKAETREGERERGDQSPPSSACKPRQTSKGGSHRASDLPGMIARERSSAAAYSWISAISRWQSIRPAQCRTPGRLSSSAADGGHWVKD